MKPKVSIIIPVFNGESFIGRAIESCLSQVYTNLEIIVVDDGSTDRTASIVDKYVKRGSVSYIYQENAERSAARNHGVRRCNGEYIQFLDADDEILPEKISSQVKILNEDTKLAAVYSATIFKRDEHVLKHLFHHPKRGLVEEIIVTNFIPINSLLFRKRALNLFDESIRLLEDWKQLLQIVADGWAIVGVNRPLCIVNIHSENSSKSRVAMATAELVVISWLKRHPNLSNYKDAIYYAKVMRLYELGRISWLRAVKSVWLCARAYIGAAIIFATKDKIKKMVFHRKINAESSRKSPLPSSTA